MSLEPNQLREVRPQSRGRLHALDDACTVGHPAGRRSRPEVALRFDRLAEVSVAQSASRSVCRILSHDPALAEVIPSSQREQAIAECIARAVHIPAGPWGSEGVSIAPDGVGLLVLQGLLIRRVGVDGRFGAELLGEGDLLRPWQGEDVPPTLPRTTGWRVLEPAGMALLDMSAARRLARYPELIGRLVGRALERSRNLTVNMAIVHQPRVDVRLHMLFWQLADRWGRVRPDGISVPLHLTHEVLADLAAARRPTVSSALSELANRGLVRSSRSGWLLSGEPPGELLELQQVALGEPDTNRSER
jgi:CRP/FNR family transcriptional regulator, cyclic AMP receptor protein